MKVRRVSTSSKEQAILSRWSVPSRCWGLSVACRGLHIPDEHEDRVGSDVMTWVVASVEGAIFDPGHLTSGRGLAFIGNWGTTDVVLSSVVQKLVSTPEFSRRYGPFGPDWMTWTSAPQMHSAKSVSEFVRPDLLVVSPLTAAEYWTIPSVVAVMEGRIKKAKPTLLALTPEDHRTVKGNSLAVKGSASYSALRQLLEYAVDEVRV